MERLALALFLLVGGFGPAAAALSPATLGTVAAAPAAGSAAPLSAPFTDLDGRLVSLAQALGGRPSLLILSDYRCTQLCGSILAIAAGALHASGLVPNRDFTLAVVGFNPDAGAADGRAMRDDQLSAFPDLKADAHLLTGAPAAVGAVEKALGFTAVRDTADERFAHPADIYVLTADGRVSRVLNGLSLDPETVRLALVEAGQGRIGSLIDRLHVLCYGLNPLSGASNGLAQLMLRAGASLTLVLAGALGALALRRRARQS